MLNFNSFHWGRATRNAKACANLPDRVPVSQRSSLALLLALGPAVRPVLTLKSCATWSVSGVPPCHSNPRLLEGRVAKTCFVPSSTVSALLNTTHLGAHCCAAPKTEQEVKLDSHTMSCQIRSLLDYEGIRASGTYGKMAAGCTDNPDSVFASTRREVLARCDETQASQSITMSVVRLLAYSTNFSCPSKTHQNHD